jgi:hypothetical protein
MEDIKDIRLVHTGSQTTPNEAKDAKPGEVVHRHHYTVHDHKYRPIAHMMVTHYPHHDNGGDIGITTKDFDHPDKIKGTDKGEGDRVPVGPHLAKKAFGQVKKLHPEIKHFIFNRTGKNNLGYIKNK